MTIIFDETTKLTKRVTFETTDGSFRKFHIFESVVNYPGYDTYSCAYLFQPLFDIPKLDLSFDLVNITSLQTHAF